MTSTLISEIRNKISAAMPSSTLEELGFRVVNYLELNNYNHIEDFIDEKGIILYTPISQRQLGHYSCLWLAPRTENQLNDILSYWCSYGFNLSYTALKSDYMQKTPEKDEDYLIHLVKDFVRRGGKFTVNEVKFQNLSENVSDCGRWCILRLMKRDLNHIQFEKWFDTIKQKKLNNDEIVTMLTYII